MSYAVSVTLTNEDAGYCFAEWVEDIHEYDLDEHGQPISGDIYRTAQAEYGRCTSSIYVDMPSGPPKRVGWFFVSRERYEDTGEPYLRGAWVSVVERIPEQRFSVAV